jgi:hypothetical protein
MFTPDEKMHLLNRLPALELSYEPKLHKKVYSSLYYIIPKGPKALVWYTYWKDQNVCLLIKINERGNYSDVQLFTSVFSDQLALGTIIYGTYFLHYNRHYFTCEKLYYYQGLAVAKKTVSERLQLLLAMFTEHVEQVAYTPQSLIVGMPIITETYEEGLEQLDKQPYKTYGLGGGQAPQTPLGVFTPTPPWGLAPPDPPFASKPSPNLHQKVPRVIPQGGVWGCQPPRGSGGFTPQGGLPPIFRVKASLAADNYQLYTAENTFYETAMVPTYKCSVMMNALFRNIKENVNLDLLEESDDEDEFENTQIDKFVDLEKTVCMECVYSKRFRKWQPVKIVTNANPRIITLPELLKKNI